MVGKCDEAVYIAAAINVAEFANRLFHSDGTLDTSYLRDTTFSDFKNHIFILFYVFSICSTVFYVSGLKSPKFSPKLESYIPLLYLYDSAAAIGLGYSLYYEHRYGVVISMVVLTNFFMLHILHSIFSTKSAYLLDELVATTKAYIHHTSNFFFLDSAHKETIIIATIWRAISMSGHTAQALKLTGTITEKQLYRFNWVLSHVRNAYIVVILSCCVLSPQVREGFGLSAVGHVGYMLVRAGPVYRLGSVYVGDRPRWQGLTDSQRLAELLQGRHPFMSIEVGSLLFLVGLFLCWRFTADGVHYW